MAKQDFDPYQVQLDDFITKRTSKSTEYVLEICKRYCSHPLFAEAVTTPVGKMSNELLRTLRSSTLKSTVAQRPVRY